MVVEIRQSFHYAIVIVCILTGFNPVATVTPLSLHSPTATSGCKQVGVAAWLECWLSHLGVAGSSPGHMRKLLGEKVALVRLCMIDGTKQAMSVSFSGHISDGLSMVSVRAKPHKGYVNERVRSSAA